ncbi:MULTISPECIES: molybdopterin-dependent oxidoreductase [Streptomyces]|uniref:Oxidoreductase molybdopterin-binding domain-containing protein n=1 Tax=Streptomyces mordarskii TaxID=1226758 RepID=A0ABN1D7R5_9ACTN|nr:MULTISPECIES: molybdopterin-dependent oxidoreductase [Streptomyces]QTI90436.1 molybdopterin-dependent oxidoreductase [Streptomyces sp. AgN23]WTA86577.1 molybdopterin-dependent oxidoreductase [Streptomyces antimycoticus]WTB11029.1 molybdopterin-dependent oxidoreductase [Streptomyces antimycoticus]
MAEKPKPRSGGAPVGRRAMLGMLGAGTAGLAAAPYLQRGWENFLAAASEVDATGLTGLLPNPGGFRYYSVVGSVPHKNESNYELTVGGLVQKPKTYTLADLRAMPQTRVVHDVVCTDGWRVEKTPFDGVKLADILDDAGVRSPGAAIRFTCFDGAYTESLTLEQARRSDVLVALNMQDKPISHDHGGPVRLYVAPMYFYKSAKWLSGISVTDKVVPGYWEERGYAVDGWLDGADRHSA